jgi:hypothetical protein
MAAPAWLSAPATPLAECILRYLYAIPSSNLKALKNFLNAIIAFIDAQIKKLWLLLAQYDLLAKAEEILWNAAKQVIDAIKNQLLTVPDGPGLNQCPEFYEYFMAPAVALFEALTEGLSVYRGRYQGLISYMDEVDALIAYWNNIKLFMGYGIEVADDAILVAIERELNALNNVIS